MTREQHVRELTNRRRSNDGAVRLCKWHAYYACLSRRRVKVNDKVNAVQVKAICRHIENNRTRCSSQSFLSILHMFLPRNSSITLGPFSSHFSSLFHSSYQNSTAENSTPWRTAQISLKEKKLQKWRENLPTARQRCCLSSSFLRIVNLRNSDTGLWCGLTGPRALSVCKLPNMLFKWYWQK